MVVDLTSPQWIHCLFSITGDTIASVLLSFGHTPEHVELCRILVRGVDTNDVGMPLPQSPSQHAPYRFNDVSRPHRWKHLKGHRAEIVKCCPCPTALFISGEYGQSFCRIVCAYLNRCDAENKLATSSKQCSTKTRPRMWRTSAEQTLARFWSRPRRGEFDQVAAETRISGFALLDCSLASTTPRHVAPFRGTIAPGNPCVLKPA